MKVLVLSPCPERIAPALEIVDYPRYDRGIAGVASTDDLWPIQWVVAFGWPRILTPGFVERHSPNIINIHIGALPYNRGADPNFWSWFDDTPKGVTIHQIARGLDTGPILAQRILPLSNAHTLRSSYDVLMRAAGALFAETWPDIRAGKIKAVPQTGPSSYHRQADKERWMKNLPGWDASCEEIERLGERARTPA